MSDSEEEILLLCYLRNSLIASEIRRKLGLNKSNQNNETENDNKTKVIGEREKEHDRSDRTTKGAIRKRIWQSEKIEEGIRLYGPFGLVKELYSIDDHIERNLKISAAHFYEILDLIKDDIKKQETVFRKELSPKGRLSITLRYLSFDGDLKQLSETFRIGYKTVIILVMETCAAIYKRLQPLVMPQLSSEELYDSALKMEELTQFPNCIGILVGKLLFYRKYTRLINTKDLNRGVGEFSSPVLFALVDADYTFIAVHVLPDCPAKIKEFLATLLDAMVPEDSMPAPKLLHLTGKFLPHVALGNECMPISKYLLTPYSLDDLFNDSRKGIYNNMHCHALEVAGHALALMAHRYKFFQKKNVLAYEKLEIIIKACCCLHNFIQRKDLYRDNAHYDEIALRQASENSQFKPLESYVESTSEIGKEIRENFLSHFSSLRRA